MATVSMPELKKEKKRLRAELADVQKRIDAKKRSAVIACAWCGKRKAVAKLTLIQTHYYVRPYSCTGGDYWLPDEKQYDCPSCGKRNRGLDKDWGGCNRASFRMRGFFGETAKEHKD